ncbi:MAG: hypothetical protein K8T90_13515 [Planctomycetes bacterium]|nr:hypothetical protein [Planctomycetota bacterium]
MTRPRASTNSTLRMTAALLTAAVLAASASAAGLTTAQSSTFDADADADADADGWTILGEAQGPVYHATGGKQGGYISATDPPGSSGTSYWRAPAKFVGNQSQAFNGKLSYDIRDIGPGRTFADPDVSVQGGGVVLEFRQRKRPKGKAWAHFNVTLTGKRGWVDASTGRKATAQKMQTALSSLNVLLIRGEYRTGQETFDIDNVLLRARVK